MGSMGTYNSYRDCSLGICSIYCPQFCYFIFPPPPPSDDESSTPFSPLIIAIIGVLASAFLLVSYYTIVTRFCRRRGSVEREENHDEIMHDQWQVGSSGLDEAMIKTITVFRYKRDEGLVEGTECSVCLSEFQENECLRLLPKCSHAFHLPCIDTWLKSHSNCPLCRANVAVLAQPLPTSQSSSHVGVHSYEAQRPNDLVLVIDDRALDCRDYVVVNGDNDEGDDAKTRSDQECVEQLRRSSSLGAFSSQRNLLISDVLKIEEIKKDESWRDIGSSKGLAMKRSNSTGKFLFIDHDKGKNVLIPH